LLERRSHARAGRKVNDAIEPVPGKDTFEGGLVANVCFEQTIVRILFMTANVCALDCGIVEVIEIVNNGNVAVAFGEQAIDKLRTDETSAAGN